MPQTSAPRSFQVVDLARSLSILTVLVSHFAFFVPEPGGALAGIWDLLRSQGRAAVTLFFFVSGFLITRIVDRAPGGLSGVSLRWFYARRVGRILPLFILQIFLGILFIGIFGWAQGDHSLDFFRCFELPRDPWNPSFWLSLLTLLPFSWAANFLKTAWGDLGLHWSIFWSLAIEEQFYLFYPLFLRILPGEKILTFTLGLLAVLCLGISCGGAWTTPPGAVPVFTWSDIWCYGAIALGAVLYLMDKKRRPFQRTAPGNWNWVGAGSLVFLTGGSGLLKGGASILQAPLMDAGLFLALWGGLHLPVFESRKLRILVWPGKYCYGLYLLHMIVLYLGCPLWKALAAHAGVLFSFLAYAVAATGFAALSYHLFELPANRDIRRRFGEG